MCSSGKNISLTKGEHFYDRSDVSVYEDLPTNINLQFFLRNFVRLNLGYLEKLLYNYMYCLVGNYEKYCWALARFEHVESAW